ncbi:MAG: hypothetical protein K6F88_04810 [Ruminococcus sp.]|nr:hypothetical protein [Ruminococcus sp.]
MKKYKYLSFLLVVTFLSAVVFSGNISSFAAQSDTPEWAVDNSWDKSAHTLTGANRPASYDLRNEGVVTPVKLQNPWGTCWSFGGIAAAEISILSSLGVTYEQTNLDLSERHLAYFGNSAVTELESDSQAGEGTYIRSDDINREFTSGDLGLFTTIFAQGVGPVAESMFPYRGANALYDSATGTYSKNDDWSIPKTDEEGQPNRLINGGFVLKNGNVLPAYWNENMTDFSTGAEAIKQELLNGRGVSLQYFADQSGTYCKSDSENGVLYAQYQNNKVKSNHAVCIVGYDDNYKASNFTHTKDLRGNQLKGSDGNELTDEDAKALTTPPGDGAWIVKNSWGSNTDACVDDLGNTINNLNYGIKNSEGEYTGYFYLSYYDQTIDTTESMEFSTNLAEYGEFMTMQYDYMPSLAKTFTLTPDTDVMSSANVFTATTLWSSKVFPQVHQRRICA